MNRPKVLVTSCLPGDSQNLLLDNFELTVNEGEAYAEEELYANARGQEAIVSVLVNRLDRRFFETFPQIKIVANVAVGYDNIDVNAANELGVLVCNTPGVLTDSTADLAFGLLLATARKISSSEQYLRDGHWQRFALDLLLGVDVHHKTVGIIGLGRIGQAFAARARGFSMKILYAQHNRVSEDIEQELHATYLSLEELLANSDFVSLHCPLNSETRHLISESQFKQMKKSAILVNTSRGPIVNETALAEALEQGTIAGAGLDVFENEPAVNPKLLELDNVVLVPHIGSATIETRTAMGRLAVQAVLDAFNGVLPLNAVNKHCWDAFLAKTPGSAGVPPAS